MNTDLIVEIDKGHVVHGVVLDCYSLVYAWCIAVSRGEQMVQMAAVAEQKQKRLENMKKVAKWLSCDVCMQ